MARFDKIFLTGPESTGKSTLCLQLAEHFNTVCIPEYARSYTEKLNRPYVYDDLCKIYREQIQQVENPPPSENKPVFYDTGLFISKVWFEQVYGKAPKELVKVIGNLKNDFYILCQTDIEWQPDRVRENSGQKRDFLFQEYQRQLELYGKEFAVLRGRGSQRFKNALEILKSALSL